MMRARRLLAVERRLLAAAVEPAASQMLTTLPQASKRLLYQDDGGTWEHKHIITMEILSPDAAAGFTAWAQPLLFQ